MRVVITMPRSNALEKKQESDREGGGIPYAECSNAVERHVAPEAVAIYDSLFEDDPRVKDRHSDGDLGDER